MSEIATVITVERANENGTPVVDVIVDPGGGGNITARHINPAGEDSLPLPGDKATLVDGAGTGESQAVGYLDPKNEGKALPGEKRIYARDAGGAVKVDLWLKGDGSLVASNGSGTWTLEPNGTIDLNGVKISPDGKATFPGEVEVSGNVTAAEVSAGGVAFTTHVHVSAAPGSPTGPAQSPPAP